MNATTALVVRIFIIGLLAISVADAGDRKDQPAKLSKKPVDIEMRQLEGIWEQRFIYRGKWQGMLQSEVVLNNDKLNMNVLNQNSDPSLIPSRGISNVRHVIDTWTFDSDWGNYGTGNLVLTQQAKDNYAGYAYKDGAQHGANEWVRVANLVARHQKTSNGRLVNIYESTDTFVVTLVEAPESGTAIETAGFEYQHPKLVLKLGGNSGTQTERKLFTASSWTIPKDRINRIAEAEISIQHVAN